MTRLISIALAVVGGAVVVFHPSRPLYMRSSPVTIESRDGVTLGGTLSAPRWHRKPVPAMVLVHGSGPLTRHHLLGDTRALVRLGFAVLAYDKRGTGESAGDYPRQWGDSAESVLRLLAADAAAALEELARAPGVDSARVGFFGASQASWIIPLAAELVKTPPRFQVILSGAAVSTGVEAYYSSLTGDGIRAAQLTDRAEIERRVIAFDGNAGFDPMPILARSSVPTLWLLGDRDASVPTFATVRVLEAIRAAGNESHSVVRYPAADHGLMDSVTGKVAPIWTEMKGWLVRIGVVPD